MAKDSLYHIAVAICRIRHGERKRTFRLPQDIVVIEGPYMHRHHLFRLTALQPLGQPPGREVGALRHERIHRLLLCNFLRSGKNMSVNLPRSHILSLLI